MLYEVITTSFSLVKERYPDMKDGTTTKSVSNRSAGSSIPISGSNSVITSYSIHYTKLYDAPRLALQLDPLNPTT